MREEEHFNEEYHRLLKAVSEVEDTVLHGAIPLSKVQEIASKYTVGMPGILFHLELNKNCVVDYRKGEIRCP